MSDKLKSCKCGHTDVDIFDASSLYFLKKPYGVCTKCGFEAPLSEWQYDIEELLSEIDRLKAEKQELVEALERIVRECGEVGAIDFIEWLAKQALAKARGQE